MTEQEPQINFQHPAILQAIENRLHSVIGKSSGYIESLPGQVKRRINALKHLQIQDNKLEADLQKEIKELEKKYMAQRLPLYEKRKQFVTGQVEPTEEEGQGPLEGEDGENVKGIPEFWLTALKNLNIVAETITEADEGALKHLIDIQVENLAENPGFKINFVFEENEFFANQVLVKTYNLAYPPENSFAGDVIYDYAEGCNIEWKEGKDLTQTVETKKQKHKGTGKVRTIKKVIPQESFFHFFKPPTAPQGDEEVDEDDLAQLEETLEMDYEMGEAIKLKLVPKAIDWFTGEALAFEDDEFEDDYDDEEYGEDDEEEEEDDDDKDENAQTQGNPPECKQQ